MPDLPEHRVRYIRDYVDGQVRDDEDKVELVQQVGTRRILGRMYEMFDVQCQQSRWWVITEPTNLYMQSDFPEVEQAFIFHLGLGLFMAQRSRMDMEEEREEHVAGSWRRYQQAIDAMDSATEAADYQAIGIRCREALLALVHEHADADWIGEVPDPPQRANFKAWGNIFAERLARDDLRAYAKALVDKTWGLAVWLQHYDDATPWDAEIVVDATADLLGVFGMLLHRQEKGPPARCPRCGSYGLDEDVQTGHEPTEEMINATACRACDWRSEETFISFEEYARDKDFAGYLGRPAQGPSDRLHRGDPTPK
jgi:hypothetical protein